MKQLAAEKHQESEKATTQKHNHRHQEAEAAVTVHHHQGVPLVVAVHHHPQGAPPALARVVHLLSAQANYYANRWKNKGGCLQMQQKLPQVNLLLASTNHETPGRGVTWCTNAKQVSSDPPINAESP